MTFLYLLTAIVCVTYVLLMLFYWVGWQRTGRPSEAKHIGSTKISVILSARNEEANILRSLAALQQQNYPEHLFEVLVVDDHSSDRTGELVTGIGLRNGRLIRLSSGQQGKKAAIREGVKQATGSLIVTTDADCEAGPHWLSSIVSCYESQHPKMIIGPVLLEPAEGLMQTIQSQEMMVLTTCAGGSAGLHAPILCSGANLAYEKDAFLAVNGFEDVEETSTGDDMFLMIKMNNKFPGRISYLKDPKAVVLTHAEITLSATLRQRKRWSSKTFLYGMTAPFFVAALIFLTNFLIIFSGILSAINLKFVLVPVTCFIAKFLADSMLLISAASFFNRPVQLFIFLFASLLYPVYVSVLGLISPFTPYSWKSRSS